MNKTFLFLIFFCLLLARSRAQNTLPADQHLERVLPPSPEVSSITKNGDLNVSLNTGTANASIPIYEIKLKGFSLPIILNYSSSGTKVDEVPGRTGMGWNLSAGGVVSRKVNGNPDDQTTLIEPPASILTVSTPMVNYFNDISDPEGSYDSEPDEFIISAGGLSGRFIIDADSNIVQIPYSNNKIEVTRAYGNYGDFTEVRITTSEGIKYIFNVPELTWEHNSSSLAGKQHIVTALFLKKIVLLNGDFIEFNYTAINSRVYNSITQYYEKSIVEMNAGQYCQVEEGVDCADGKGFSEKVNFALYHTFYLSGIKASDSTKLNFTYEDRPDDGSDNRLKKIEIDLGGYKKNYLFDYVDPEAGGYTTTTYFSDYNRRFFLDKIKYYAEANGGVTDTLRYKFDYNNLADLPQRLSYCQDHFGYFNAKGNSGLLPSMPVEEDFGYTATADRTPDGSAAVAGTLKKITYPTGGSQEFSYEPNIYTTQERLNTYVSMGTGGPGGLNNTAAIYTSNTFSVNRAHNATLLISSQQNLACEGEQCTPPEPNTQTIVKVEVINQTTSSIIISKLLRYYEDQSWSVYLEPGNVYYLKLYAYGYASAGETSLTYDTAANEYMYITVNKELGGVRVRKITSCDSVTSKVNNKFYKYSFSNDLEHSSAYTLWTPDYKTYYHYTHQCDCQGDPSECSLYIIPETITCYYVNLNSSSATSIYMLDSSPFGYQSVIESDDSTFSNGGIIHYFDVYDIVASSLVYGNDMKNLPRNTATSTSGMETSTEYFDSTHKIIKKTQMFYSQDNMINSVSTRAVKNFQLNSWTFGNTTADYLTQFDVSQYTYVSDWIKLDSTITKEYDDNNIVSTRKVTTVYGTSANILPIRTEMVNSKGQLLKEEIKYASDYSGQAPYQRMIDSNIISTVVETKSYVAGNLMRTIKKNYHDFSASQTAGSPIIITPQTVQVQNAGGSLETRLHYYKYDQKGNPIEVSKSNDVKLAYVWDYNKNYPVAEVNNADSASIAYTSFEADGKGNWTYSGSASSDATSPTGTKCYLASGGNITKSGLTNSTYIISYWGKTGSVNVNSSGPTRTGRSLGNWTYYEHEVTTTSITVSGSNYIDELRLYPKGALMSTVTYIPSIGISSQCDANNRISYYEYDPSGRLTFIRDQDRNILKKICYNYAGQPGNCGIYKNVSKSGNFTRNNCSSGYVGSTVTYSVPADTYTSTISQSHADSIAQSYVNANGQSYANTNGTCTQLTIYARIEYTDWYYDVNQVYATVLIKFYSNAGCTTPVSVSGLTVNYERVKYPCEGGTTTNNYNISCSGTQQSLGTQMISWDDTGDGGSHCWEYVFNTTSGSGYTVAY